MRWTVVGLVAAGVAAAASASVLTMSLRAERRLTTAVAQPPAAPPEVSIVVAARDLEALTVLDTASVGERRVPAAEAPAGALVSPHQAVGRVLAVPLLEGQALREAGLLREDSGLHLASALPAGGRAVRITLSEDDGLETLLYPGCLVDVIASFRLPSRTGGATEVVSATVLQGVRVLAIGDRSVVSGPAKEVEIPARAPRNLVTLLVDSRQAEALQLALAHGTVTLALRNPNDTARSTGQGMLLSDLSDTVAERLAALLAPPAEPAPSAEPPVVRAPVAAPPPDPQKWETVVLHGKAVETKTFPAQEGGRENEP